MWILWTARKMNKWVVGQITPELALEAKIMKLKVLYFGHIMRRQDSLEKTIMLGKVEVNRKRGRPNTRGIDPLKESTALSLQEPSKAVEDRTCQRSHS